MKDIVNVMEYLIKCLEEAPSNLSNRAVVEIKKGMIQELRIYKDTIKEDNNYNKVKRYK